MVKRDEGIPCESDKIFSYDGRWIANVTGIIMEDLHGEKYYTEGCSLITLI